MLVVSHRIGGDIIFLILTALIFAAFGHCAVISQPLTRDVNNFRRVQHGPENSVSLARQAAANLFAVHGRFKRWDYMADGCHCSGFKVECLRDSFCQMKYKDPSRKCVKGCCGFQCVIGNEDQRNNDD